MDGTDAPIGIVCADGLGDELVEDDDERVRPECEADEREDERGDDGGGDEGGEEEIFRG